MIALKRISILFISLILAFRLCPSVYAGDIDLGKWNTESSLYTVLNDKYIHSNCAVVMAFLRTDYDRPSNRIKMLFSLELDSFTDESNSGIRLSVNGGGDIILHADGTAEYNEEEYFAEMVTDSDPRTKTLYLEVTLGIKKGIPDTVALSFNFYDTEGVASNTYTVDITESYDSELLSGETEITTQKTNKNNSSAKKPAAQKTQAASQKESTTAEATSTTAATQHHNVGGQVVNISAGDRAFATLLGLAAVTLGSMGVFYLIRRRNDPKNGG